MFATATDFATRLGVDLTASEQTDAEALLARSSRLIQDETGQTIERVVDELLTRRGSWQSRLRLPERPVESVAAVTIDGVVVPADEWYVEGDELVRTSGWGGPEAELAITYTHGFAVIPEVAKTASLEAVVRVWVNPGSVRQEGYGTEQVTYQAGDGLFLRPRELRAIRRALRRQARSVTLR